MYVCMCMLQFGGPEEVIEITEEIAQSFKVKVKNISGFTLVWNSSDTQSQAQVSIWSPNLQTSYNRVSPIYSYICTYSYYIPTVLCMYILYVQMYYVCTVCMYVCMYVVGMLSWYHFALRIYNRFKWNPKELQDEDDAEQVRADAIYGDDVTDQVPQDKAS